MSASMKKHARVLRDIRARGRKEYIPSVEVIEDDVAKEAGLDERRTTSWTGGTSGMEKTKVKSRAKGLIVG